LGEVSGDYPPLDGLTKLEELSLKTFDLKDSSFIEHCPNLRVLRLGQVRRSLPPLDTLTRLEILEVAGNWDNAEVLGSIKGCKSLRELRFWGWRCDLAPLSGLSNLRVLHVHVNGRSRAPIRQWLKPLGNLLNLEDLSVTRYGEDFDEPTDLGPLGSLSGLRYLALQQNQIHDLNPLTGLVNLKELQLGANSVSDLRPLSALGNLGLLFLEDNQIRDISPLASLTGLQWLSLGHNQIGDIRPLAKLEDLRILQVERNRIQDISPLVGLLQLGQYRPFDTDGRYLERMRVVRRESGSWSTAFGYGNGDDVVSVIGNPLNDDAYRLHIPALQQRGIRVRFNPKPSGQVIRFGDKNLERAVRDKLMIPNRPIYESDNVVTLSNLRATQAGISDLDGIEHCTNLRELDLQNNPIRDLRPLAELTKLESLRLGGNKIVDVSPLAELPNLTELFVNNNPIRDIRPLAKVSQLKALWLSSDGIQDISPLSRLSHLTSLNLSGNRIQDISPLAHLSHLSALDLRSNRIHDVSPLRRLTELGTPPTPWVGAAVDLRDNPLDQEAYAVHIPALLATLKAKGATLLFTPKP
jgi:Leucine-rich repeat (LRR) protein